MLISITIYQTLQIYTLFFILSYYTKFSMSRNHFSHYSQILGNADLFAKDYPLLNELLLSSFVNIIIGIIFYLIVSSLSYFIFYVQQK